MNKRRTIKAKNKSHLAMSGKRLRFLTIEEDDDMAIQDANVACAKLVIEDSNAGKLWTTREIPRANDESHERLLHGRPGRMKVIESGRMVQDNFVRGHPNYEARM